jgi:hypothetical protein
MRMGAGSQVMACVYQHPGPFKKWTGSWSEDLWAVKAHHVRVAAYELGREGTRRIWK